MSRLMAISELPSAGLGNKLFPWAAGAVFSSVNRCPHFVTGMTRFHIGPWLRGEKSKRLYFDYFENEKVFIMQTLWSDLSYMPLVNMSMRVTDDHPFVFNQVPPWDSLFEHFKPHREIIRRRFLSSLTQKVKDRIIRHDQPVVAVHVRMGDFRPLLPGEDFNKVGSVRTPLSYFCEIIDFIRSGMNSRVPVTIFSDGSDQELRELLDIEGVQRAVDDLDIVHLAVMSRSSCIVTSPGSTFGYWSGFLSAGAIIHHPDHFNQTIRDESVSRVSFEGTLSSDLNKLPDLLKHSLDLRERELN